MKRIILLLIIILIAGCSQEIVLENKEINELILKLSDGNYGVRLNASNELTEIGEEAVPFIIESLKKDSYDNTSSKSFNARWNKVNVLGRIGSNKAEDALIERILNDEETHVRWRAIWALSIVKDEKTYAKLIEGLDNEKTRWRAAVALGALRNDKATETLLGGLNSSDDWIRWEAIYVLGILGDPSTAKEVSKLLKDNSTRIRQETALTLGKLGNPEVIPGLINTLEDENPGVRWRAASALANIGNESVIPIIEEALKKEDDMEAYDYINKSLERLKE